jgi:phosphoserine phosphatase
MNIAMTTPHWQPQSAIDAVIFDCDGTLTTIEGIDVLAEHNGVGHEVSALTALAMNTSGVSTDMYTHRLNRVAPSYKQVHELGLEYFANRIEDVSEVINILKRLNKEIYIVSAGLYPAVRLFGELLKIPDKNIFAVDITFDTHGKYLNYDHQSPLVVRNGKRAIISEIKKYHKNLIFIGDGINDLEAKDLVERFVGYGGKFYRENIAAFCQYYITTLSMAPFLALSLTSNEVSELIADEKLFYDKGVTAIQNGKVMIR